MICSIPVYIACVCLFPDLSQAVQASLVNICPNIVTGWYTIETEHAMIWNFLFDYTVFDSRISKATKSALPMYCILYLETNIHEHCRLAIYMTATFMASFK